MVNKLGAALAIVALASSPAAAAPRVVPVAFEIAHCPASRGTIAVVEGDMQGWSRYKLGSPRDLLNAMVRASGCFTVHDTASGRPADYLLSAMAGDQATVQRSVGESVARTAAGVALGQLIPFGGLLMGLGKKKKPVAAGLRVISPSTGVVLLSASGAPSTAVVTLAENRALGAYINTRDGQSVSSAFATAYNGIVAQTSALGSGGLVAAPSTTSR